MIGVSACLQLLIITTIFSPFSHTALILGGMIAYRRFSFYVDSVNIDSFYNIIGVSAIMGQAEKISAKEGCQKIGAFMW